MTIILTIIEFKHGTTYKTNPLVSRFILLYYMVNVYLYILKNSKTRWFFTVAAGFFFFSILYI